MAKKETIKETKLRYQLQDIVVRGLVKDSEFSAKGFKELFAFILKALKSQRKEIIEMIENIKSSDTTGVAEFTKMVIIKFLKNEK